MIWSTVVTDRGEVARVYFVGRVCGEILGVEGLEGGLSWRSGFCGVQWDWAGMGREGGVWIRV